MKTVNLYKGHISQDHVIDASMVFDKELTKIFSNGLHYETQATVFSFSPDTYDFGLTQPELITHYRGCEMLCYDIFKNKHGAHIRSYNLRVDGSVCVLCEIWVDTIN